MELEVDIKPRNVAEKVRRALFDGITEGMEETGSDMVERGKDKGEDLVFAKDRVWNQQVLHGFEGGTSGDLTRRNHWSGSIINTAPHADIVDRGLAPAGEITGSNPSVQDIIAWVDSEMDPDVSLGGGGGGGDGGSFQTHLSGRGNQPPPYGFEDYTLTNYRSTTDLGIPEEQFSSAFPRVAESSDGRNIIWKSHDMEHPDDAIGNPQEEGGVRNEYVYSKAMEFAGADTGPISRLDRTTIYDEYKDEEITLDGTTIPYIEGPAFTDVVHTSVSENYDERLKTRDDWLRENREWAAEHRVLTYLVRNGDFHHNNVKFNEDGEPRAFDNGGSTFRDSLDPVSLLGLQEMEEFRYAENPDQLKEEYDKVLDDVEFLLEKYANDEDLREEIVNAAEEVHPDGGRWQEAFKDTLGEEITDKHILSENSDGVPLWKQHIDTIRERVQTRYDDRRLYAQPIGPDPKEDPNVEIEDHLQNLIDF